MIDSSAGQNIPFFPEVGDKGVSDWRGLVLNTMGKRDPWLIAWNDASNSVGKDVSKSPKVLGTSWGLLVAFGGEKWLHRPIQSQHFLQRLPRHLKQSSQHSHFCPGALGLQRWQSFIMIQNDTRATHTLPLHLLNALNSSWLGLPCRRRVSLINMFSITNTKKRSSVVEFLIVS